MRLKDKVVIVTGSAQGIGEATARCFAREGAKLMVCDIQGDRIQEVAGRIEEDGGEAISLRVDVGKREDVQALMEVTRERYGRLDVLVNNAGVGLTKAVDEVDTEDYDRVMDTNLRGMYLGCSLGVPLMKESGGGSIINIASVHGVEGCKGNTVYAASKGGIIGCTRALAADLAAAKIRVNAISPGAIYIRKSMEGEIEKEAGAENMAEFMELFGDKVRDNFRYFQPLEQVGETEDIAHCALFLASEEAKFITGQNITVDGGMTTLMPDFDALTNSMEQLRTSEGEMEKWIEEHKSEG